MTVSCHTSFCDDIREEISGKITLVGVYGVEIQFDGELPLALPKFGFNITATFDLEDRDNIADSRLRVFIPGDPMDQPTIDGETGWMPPSGGPPEGSDLYIDSTPRITCHLHFVLAPFFVPGEGVIRVRLALNDGRTINGGGIRVRRRSAQEAPIATN